MKILKEKPSETDGEETNARRKKSTRNVNHVVCWDLCDMVIYQCEAVSVEK